MASLTFNGNTYIVDHAVKGANYVHGYNANGECIIAIEGVSNFDKIRYSGAYLAPEACVNEACNEVLYVNGALVLRSGKSVNVAQQIESAEHPGCYYRMVNNEKEWLNPPMVAGEVYRTTERFNGYPVYVSALEISDVSADNCTVPFNEALKLSPAGTGVLSKVISITGTAVYNTVDYWPLPIGDDTSYCVPVVDWHSDGVYFELGGSYGDAVHASLVIKVYWEE